MSARVVKDQDFANRLATACENNPKAPSGHGRGRWLMRRLNEEFNIVVSPEGVRRWFAGEARPKPDMMSKVARVLEVDEAWLSLGVNPLVTLREKKRQNALTNGAVNLVAAQLQLAGGNIAFPDDGVPGIDLLAIIRGKQYDLTVRLSDPRPKATLIVPPHAKAIIVVSPTSNPIVFDFVRVPLELVEQYGRLRGGFIELEIERTEQGYEIDGEKLPVIKSFDNLEGQAPKGVSEAAKRALDL